MLEVRAGGIGTDVALQPVEEPALVAQVTEATGPNTRISRA
jgi:hypothetical protein